MAALECELAHAALMETLDEQSPESSDVTRALIAVVDDDESVRESLPDLLKELGFAAQAFASANEFLTSGQVDTIRCLLLDIAMPGMTGRQLQRELTLRGHSIPIVFITAGVDKKIRQELIGLGAVECLFKPFSEQDLRAALDMALRRL
jgi:FixJ family two-component response regulator